MSYFGIAMMLVGMAMAFGGFIHHFEEDSVPEKDYFFMGFGVLIAGAGLDMSRILL